MATFPAHFHDGDQSTLVDAPLSSPLLTTKLYIPPPRPCLVEWLNEGIRSDRKLTLVSTPAGFGKITLLSEWL
jgi:LuxR family maltose regulon positive regulatory protein